MPLKPFVSLLIQLHLTLGFVLLPLWANAAEIDIIVALDNSASMSEEAGFLQAELNTFVNQLTAVGHDVHLVAISADSGDPEGLCTPAPLGSGSCPADDNLPGYRHVVQSVGSNNALARIVSEYPSYSSSLRPGSVRHVLVVSDDDSSTSAAMFSSELAALDTDFIGFTFHAIAVLELRPTAFPAPGPYNPCDALVPSVGGVGQVYIDLAAFTGGVFGDLCDQNFGPAMGDIATAIFAGAPLPVPGLQGWAVRGLLALGLALTAVRAVGRA